MGKRQANNYVPPPTNTVSVNIVTNSNINTNDYMRRFNNLYNTVQNEIDKHNIESITRASRQGNNIIVDELSHNLILSWIYNNKFYTTHSVKIYDAKIEINSSNDIAFDINHMHQKVHKNTDINKLEYEYPEQMHMTTVINYLHANGINYIIYNPSMQLTDYDVFISCRTYNSKISKETFNLLIKRKFKFVFEPE